MQKTTSDFKPSIKITFENLESFTFKVAKMKDRERREEDQKRKVVKERKKKEKRCVRMRNVRHV